MSHNENRSKKYFPIIAFSSILVITLVLFLGVGWQSWHSHKDIVEIQGRDIRLQKLVGIIVHLDEVLAMSARMGVETGHLQWEERYLRYEPQLEAAIKEAEKLAPETFLFEAAAQTDAANVKLVAMEKHAFQLLHHGQKEAASTIFFSKEYEEQKKVYAEGMEQITNSIQESANDHIKVQHQQTFLTFVAILITLPCVIFAWMYVLRLMSRYNIERKYMEEKLRELSRAVEQSPCTIMITGTSGKIEYVNPKFTQLTGYTYKEAVGQNPRILKTGKTPPEVYECLWKTILSGGDWSGEFCNKKKNGDLYWESASISPVKNGEGTITNFVAVKEDITVRKRMEEELRMLNESLEQRVVERTEKLKKAANLLNDIINATSDLIFVKDVELRTIMCNEAFASAVGKKPEELIGKTDIENGWNPELVYGNPGKGIHGYENDDRLALGGRIVHNPADPANLCDEIRFFDTKRLPMFDANGKITGLLGIARDLTERKRAEEQIKASLKEKEALLDEVHHRVKNNLQIISSLLDMSSMRTQNQETIELFAESRNRVEAMALIHSQLYESERFDEIDMERHIQELSGNLLNIYSKEKTITLDIKSANVFLPVTLAVPCALVLNELISNALKHAYREGQQGIVSISMQQSNDGTTLLKVEDNGVGIPEEIDIEMSKSLGLKLVRNIVYKQLNGIMKIIKNKGTEFTVEFKHSKEDS